MAVEDVAIRWLAVDQAIAGARCTPPAADEMTWRAVVDPAVDGTAEGGVPVVAAGGRPAYRGVGGDWLKEIVDGRHDQGGRRHRHLGKKVASAGVMLGLRPPHRPLHQLGHVE
jgi:hypothetical protein